MLFAPTQSLFTWRGHYWGFIRDDRMFDRHGLYAGWIEDGRAWAKDGSYLGDFLPDGYILKPRFCGLVMKRVPPFFTFNQAPPIFRPSDRLTHIERLGFVDPLEG